MADPELFSRAEQLEMELVGRIGQRYEDSHPTDGAILVSSGSRVLTLTYADADLTEIDLRTPPPVGAAETTHVGWRFLFPPRDDREGGLTVEEICATDHGQVEPALTYKPTVIDNVMVDAAIDVLEHGQPLSFDYNDMPRRSRKTINQLENPTAFGILKRKLRLRAVATHATVHTVDTSSLKEGLNRRLGGWTRKKLESLGKLSLGQLLGRRRS